MLQAAEGKDPVAEKKAERSKGTFEELATRYVEEYSKKENKSWMQADRLVRKHLIPKWGKLPAASIARSDVKAMMGRIAAPIMANQTLAAASAIFAWAIREDLLTINPCQHVKRNETHERERVLSDSELPMFWEAFKDEGLAGIALKVLLLTGQRPGEVLGMRTEHITDGWWTLPGEPAPDLDWNGTKNGKTHRVWLTEQVRELIAQTRCEGKVFDGVTGIDPPHAPDLRRCWHQGSRQAA